VAEGTGVAEKIGVAFIGCVHPHLPRDGSCWQPRRTSNWLVGDPELAAMAQARTGLPVFASATELLDQAGVRLPMVEGWDRDNPGSVAEAAS